MYHASRRDFLSQSLAMATATTANWTAPQAVTTSLMADQIENHTHAFLLGSADLNPLVVDPSEKFHGTSLETCRWAIETVWSNHSY